MSRPSWDPFPHAIPTSGHATTAASTNVTPTSISSPSPISSEDARLLDPSYLSSFPLATSSAHHGYFGFGSGLSGGGGGGAGLHTHTHAIPYVDAQGTLHDPDYRPFPLIQHTKHTPSPFAVRKPYWEIDEEWEIDGKHGDDGDDSGSAPNTPTSTTPFFCYFLETHPLKRGDAQPRSGSSRPVGPNKEGSGRGKGRRLRGGNAGTRSQLKLSSAYMYATISTGLGGRSQTHAYSPTTPTFPSAALPITTTPASTSITDNENGEKEKRGWGGILRRAGRKEGGEKE